MIDSSDDNGSASSNEWSTPSPLRNFLVELMHDKGFRAKEFHLVVDSARAESSKQSRRWHDPLLSKTDTTFTPGVKRGDERSKHQKAGFADSIVVGWVRNRHEQYKQPSSGAVAKRQRMLALQNSMELLEDDQSLDVSFQPYWSLDDVLLSAAGNKSGSEESTSLGGTSSGDDSSSTTAGRVRSLVRSHSLPVEAPRNLDRWGSLFETSEGSLKIGTTRVPGKGLRRERRAIRNQRGGVIVHQDQVTSLDARRAAPPSIPKRKISHEDLIIPFPPCAPMEDALPPPEELCFNWGSPSRISCEGASLTAAIGEQKIQMRTRRLDLGEMTSWKEISSSSSSSRKTSLKDQKQNRYYNSSSLISPLDTDEKLGIRGPLVIGDKSPSGPMDESIEGFTFKSRRSSSCS